MPRNRVIEVAAEDRSTDQHRAMLSRELGPTSFGREVHVDDGRPVGLFALLARPMGLFLLALTAFAVVLGLKLWRDGVFDPLWAPQGAEISGSRGWQLGDRVRVIERDRTKDPTPGAVPPADAAEAEADEDAE